MDKHSVLKSTSFGQRVAEEEAELLSTYFVETDQWDRLYRGDIDIVYGPKGAGKSARGTRMAPEFWVPFLYRDALELVQGAADVSDG